MSKIKDTDYAYSVSRIHAVERSLLDSGKIMQIAEAKTAADALRMIYDAGYKAEEDYEISFEQALDEAYSLVYSMAPEPEIFDVFLIENDYYNLKVLLKAEFIGKNLDYLLSGRSRTLKDKLKEAVRERRGGDISDIFANAIDEALESFAKNKNAQLVDMIIDRACFEEMSKFAALSGNKFLMGLISMKIDLINIKTMIRLRRMEKDYAFAKRAMLEGGSIPADTLAMGVGEAKDTLLQRFSSGKYAQLIADAVSGEKDMAGFETACGDMLVEYMKSAKRVIFGAEPLIAYIFAKDNEIKQLRIIMVGKTNSMDSELIKRRLNIAYV